MRLSSEVVFGLVIGGALVTGCSASSPAGMPEEGIGTGDGASSSDPRDGGAKRPADEAAAPGVDAGGEAAAGPDSSPAGDAGDGSDAGPKPTGSPGPWTPVSFGITASDTGVGDNVLVAYGGYTATDHDSQAWATALWSARLGQLGVGHLYAARGPRDASYAAREIGNSTLASRLATQAASATAIIVVAHSSGAFVADELFTFATPAVLAKIAYFDLDGGSWALTNTMVGSMKSVTFCKAHDPAAGDSHNASAIVSLHSQFSGSRIFTVDATGSGCNSGATWCLHDTLITNRPHNPNAFDLALDYTDFTGGRAVVTSYVDDAVSAGAL